MFIPIIFVLFLLLFFWYVERSSLLTRIGLVKRLTPEVELSIEDKSKLSEVFAEKSETFVTSLGNGYIANFLTQNTIASGFTVISDKRVYFKGRCYSRVSGRLKGTIEERVVDLKDITGTGYTRTNPLYLLFSSIGSLICFIILGNATDRLEDKMGIWLPTFGISSLIISIILFCAYLIKKKNLFEISFAGGSIAFDAFLYNKSEIDQFQKQLRVAKDSIEKSIQESSVVRVNSSTTDELKKLVELKDSGAINQDEFDAIKRTIISKM